MAEPQIEIDIDALLEELAEIRELIDVASKRLDSVMAQFDGPDAPESG